MPRLAPHTLPPRRVTHWEQLEERLTHIQEAVDELYELHPWLFVTPGMNRSASLAFMFGAMWMMGGSLAEMGGTLDWAGPDGQVIQTRLGEAPLLAERDSSRGN